MKVFLLVLHCAILCHCVHSLDEEFDEVQREEDKLPQYLKDDGIRRVAKLTKDHFNKTLKASRMMVVLFYYSSSENPDVDADRSWKTDEKMLEVGYIYSEIAHITLIQQSVSRLVPNTIIFISHVKSYLNSLLLSLLNFGSVILRISTLHLLCGN